MQDAPSVLTFWFGTSSGGIADTRVAERWYRKDAAFDREIRERFLELYLAVLRGEHEGWRSTPESCLAYVVALDQFSRNMFRDTPLAFAADRVALTAALAALDAGHDRALRGDMRAFMYLPLMHAEELAAQDRCVQCFESLVRDTEPEHRARFENNLSFAHKHREIVARFGRFPHRNELLGRASTAEERAFLAQPGSRF